VLLEVLMDATGDESRIPGAKEPTQVSILTL
jgi:hypothetical protein